MSTLSSFNNRFQHQSFDQSLNVQDLIKENQQLKQNIEMLVKQIQDMNEVLETAYNDKYSQKDNHSHQENYPNINQEELQALAHQVIELQQQLQVEKKKSQKNSQPGNNVEQTIQIITELSQEYQNLQNHYQTQIGKLQNQLATQKAQSQATLQITESKFLKTIEQYQLLLSKMKKKDQTIAEMQRRLNESSHNNKKDLKISTTIEDLRVTLERQIEQKQKTIQRYQDLCRNLKTKLSEK